MVSAGRDYSLRHVATVFHFESVLRYSVYALQYRALAWCGPSPSTVTMHD